MGVQLLLPGEPVALAQATRQELVDILNEEHLRRMDQVLLRRNLDHARMFSRKLSLELPQYVHLYTGKPGETDVFAWIVYKSRAHRDRVNAKVMKDPRMAKPPDPMPFDPKRMVFGGFKVIVEA